MQTKKRAKPVKFGKNKEEKLTKESAEADINSDEAKEIKKIIEEKTHPKEDPSASSGQEEEAEKSENENEEVKSKEEDDEDIPEQEETTEDEPEEIKLSEELPEKKEEQMALESTEAAEIEPEELQKKEEEDEDDEETAKSSTFGSFTKEEVKPPKKGYFGFFVLVASITFLVGIAAIAGISYFFPSDVKNSVKLPSFAASPTPTAEPPASPTPEEVDLTAYSVRVLNGSGITGEAAKVKTLLEEKGFKVANVGNAATSDYTKTVISAKEDINEEYLNELIKALQDEYSVNSVVEDAPSSQTADVVVTVGSESAE